MNRMQRAEALGEQQPRWRAYSSAALRYVAAAATSAAGASHVEHESAGSVGDHIRRCGHPLPFMRLCTPPDADRRAWSALRWETREEPPIWVAVDVQR
jgi:hypothetical protein